MRSVPREGHFGVGELRETSAAIQETANKAAKRIPVRTADALNFMPNFNRSPEYEYKVTLKFPENHPKFPENENGPCLVEVYVSANTAEEAELLATEENGGEAVDCIYIGKA